MTGTWHQWGPPDDGHYERVKGWGRNVEAFILGGAGSGPAGFGRLLEEIVARKGIREEADVMDLATSLALGAHAAERAARRRGDAASCGAATALLDSGERWARGRGSDAWDMMMANLNRAIVRAAFEDAGSRVYVVSPGLSQRILLTDLRGVRTDDVKMPFPAIYLSCPPGAGPSVLLRGAASWSDVRGIYAAVVTTAEGRDLLNTLVYSGAEAADVFPLVVPLPAGADLWDVVRARYPIQTDEVTARSVLSWILGALFYATNHRGPGEADEVEGNKERATLLERAARAPVGSKKRADLHRRAREEPSRPAVVLGSAILVDRDFPTTAAGVAEALASGRSAVSVRTLVAGHWRRYHCGEGGQRLEFRWISPFWRGPDGAPERRSPHVLGAEAP